MGDNDISRSSVGNRMGTDIELIRREAENFRGVSGLVMHSVSNLISAIYGMAQFAQVSDENKYASETVDIAVKNCKKLKDLIKSISEYSEGLSWGKDKIDVKDMYNSTITILGREIEKKELNIDSEIPDAMFIRRNIPLFYEMFFNIISFGVAESRNSEKLGIRVSQNDIFCLEITIYNSETGKKVERVISELQDLSGQNRDKILGKLFLVLLIATRTGGSLTYDNSNDLCRITVEIPLDDQIKG